MSLKSVKPRFTWGPFDTERYSDSRNASAWTEPIGDIPYETLNRRYFSDNLELNNFQTTIIKEELTT